MKWWMAGAGAAVVVLAAALMAACGHWQPARASAPPDDKRPEHTITATGVATVRVKPDAVRCSFGVKTTGTSFADVRADNEKKTKKITDALAGLKIDGLAVRTAPMDVQMQPDPGPQLAQPPGPGGPPPGAAPKDAVSYTITHSFGVEIKNADVDKLVAAADRVLAAAVSQGANTGAVAAGNNYYGQMGLGGGISPGGTRLDFYRQDPNAERQQALKQAVAAALANAKAAAGGAEVAVKEVVTLTDQPNTPFGFLGGGLPASPDITGETEVTVSVSVTCTY